MLQGISQLVDGLEAEKTSRDKDFGCLNLSIWPWKQWSQSEGQKEETAIAERRRKCLGLLLREWSDKFSKDI